MMRAITPSPPSQVTCRSALGARLVAARAPKGSLRPSSGAHGDAGAERTRIDRFRLQATAGTATRGAPQDVGQLSRQMFERMNAAAATSQAGGAGGGTTFEALQGADKMWERVRNTKVGEEAGPAPEFVREQRGTSVPGRPEYDVVVAGGTLGVFLAAALQLAGLKVAVVERGPLRGRAQEWNISRKEIAELVSAGIMTKDEAEEIISIEFNPIRCGFHGSDPVWVRDVLNLGVSPVTAIQLVRERFEAAGGKVFENTAITGVEVYDNGVSLPRPPSEGSSGSSEAVAPITARLLLDCMGHFSPVVRQARWGTKPDGVCCVVGACNRGHPAGGNTSGDLIYTDQPLRPTGADAPVDAVQYFWEAFPAGSGPEDRTTYLFTYVDADQRRPSLLALMDDYWRLMPSYQGVELDDLQPQRILFGFFPTFRDSPLKPRWNRILQVGDASGIQSPLSFGGFGALTRHLPRLTTAINEALAADALDRGSLAAINSYSPGLSGAWMLQRAMSVKVGQQPDPAFINTLLGTNFGAMEKLGPSVLYPFLQDVPQFGPLAATMFGQMASDPLFVPQILKHVGPGPFVDWFVHFVALGVYTVLHWVAAPPLKLLAGRLPPRQQYGLRRQLDSWRYGSGLDYTREE
eukprot:CAMPEP_0206136508 /NCGR_PEP_ID=MMETSP1473-20131121/1749_1 /ASSEMBLY_ACC=CAM_ASM_001109 /TAXON_ID=1461547 /ORGANISM="Stichococcus sp, Strain RCC1054" /LENGTH=633 /DNA_ID=CAMNT_0053529101 /DNA_START=287 /DNA_END=2188 /DNA_ORIENTATION=+